MSLAQNRFGLNWFLFTQPHRWVPKKISGAVFFYSQLLPKRLSFVRLEQVQDESLLLCIEIVQIRENRSCLHFSSFFAFANFLGVGRVHVLH